MGRGKGAIPMRKIKKVLADNGYKYIRNNGHMIFENEQGNTIAIPRSCCTYVVM